MPNDREIPQDGMLPLQEVIADPHRHSHGKDEPKHEGQATEGDQRLPAARIVFGTATRRRCNNGQMNVDESRDEGAVSDSMARSDCGRRPGLTHLAAHERIAEAVLSSLNMPGET